MSLRCRPRLSSVIDLHEGGALALLSGPVVVQQEDLIVRVAASVGDRMMRRADEESVAALTPFPDEVLERPDPLLAVTGLDDLFDPFERFLSLIFSHLARLMGSTGADRQFHYIVSGHGTQVAPAGL